MSENKKFTCPKCGRSHTRGWFLVEGQYRCLNCGYQGAGHHPDPEIDEEVQKSIDEGNAFNRAHGIPEDPNP